jgi:dihydrolipoamide dehydrogenase
MSQFDVIIIGAGPGGYICAIRLAQKGFKVAVVEKDQLGGVCLNWGCIPSKALIYAAGLFEKISGASKMGIVADNIRIEFETLQGWKQDIISKLTGGIGQLFKAHGISHLQGQAVLTSPTTVSLKNQDGSKKELNAKHIVLATGGHITELPHLKFDHRVVIDSTDALSLSVIPKHLVLVGGGVIGLELGMMYAKLGTKITLVELLPQILPGFDPELVQVMQRSLKKRGITCYLDSSISDSVIEKEGATLTLTTPKGAVVLEADIVLVAVGRKPNSQNLGLEDVGVQCDAKGFIQVNQQLKTSVANIYAIGDVTGAPFLAHKASKEGLIVADVIAGERECLDYRALPSAVFTDPEIATVGFTEQQAIDAGYTVKLGKFPFAASGRALSMGQTEGFVKVITDAKTDLILGVHMIGPDVSELIAEAALAIEMGATATDLALTIHAHPTLPESLMEAAEAVHQQALHIYTS